MTTTPAPGTNPVPATTTPPDTRTMSLVHAALRRDLDRAAVVVADTASLDEARLRALGAHLEWLMDFLHEHHSSEDERLYPRVLAKGGRAAELARIMDAEHHAILPGMDRVRAAGAAAREGTGSTDRRAAAIADALTALREHLDPHLEREELEMMPEVEKVITRQDWDEYERGNTARSATELAYIGHWVVDGLGPADTAVITSAVPAIPRFVMLHLLGGAYRRTRRACWSGTPAADIDSTPLTRER